MDKHDELTRLAKRVEAICTGQTEAERRVKAAGIAAEIRTLAQQTTCSAQGSRQEDGWHVITIKTFAGMSLDVVRFDEAKQRITQQGKAGGVPDAMPTPAFREDQPERFGYVRGWNACREAMLATPPANSPQAGVTDLIEFARWAISESSFQGCDLDGGSIQDKATDLGLLKEVQITEPCSEEGCACADSGADFPTTCYRFADHLAPQPKDAT